MPDPSDIAAVQALLRASQGPFVAKPQLPVIDEVVATVLSQHTSDLNSGRAFAQLKDKFSDWEQVLEASAGQVADAIRCGGIADQKARRIQQILATIREREGRIDLAGWTASTTGRSRNTSPPCPASARRRPPACSSSRWDGPPSRSIPTCIALPSGSDGSRRVPVRNRRTVCSVPPSLPASGTISTLRSSNTAVKSARRRIRGAGHVSCATNAPTAGKQANPPAPAPRSSLTSQPTEKAQQAERVATGRSR